MTKDHPMTVKTGIHAGLYWLQGEIGEPDGSWRTFNGWYSGVQPAWYNNGGSGVIEPTAVATVPPPRRQIIPKAP